MSWNPIDWSAGPFMTLYIVLAVALFVIGFSLKSSIGPAARNVYQLNVLDLAYLGGGAARLGDAALLCLMSSRTATIESRKHKITVSDQSPLSALVGQRLFLPFESDMTRQKFQKIVKPLVEVTQRRLQDFGYCPTDDQITTFRISTLPFVGLLVLLGIAKAIVGAGRHHPVAFVLTAVVVTLIIGIALFQRPTKTRAGKEALEAYKTSNARAARAPLEHEMLLAVALSGAVVLSGTAYAPVYAASQTMSSSGDSGGGGCGGGGGGCGGCS